MTTAYPQRRAGLWRTVVTGLAMLAAAPAWADSVESCIGKAATSAALSSCKAAAASAPAGGLVSTGIKPVGTGIGPASTPSVAPQAPAKSPAEADKAPALSPLAAGSDAPKKKKFAKRRNSDPVIANTPEPAPEPNLFGALFGQPQGEPSAAVAAATDPSSTAATDPLNGGKAKGKGKGLKSAKNDPNAPTSTVVPDGGFFDSAEDAPFASGDLGYPLLSPGNIDPMKAAIKRYADIVAAGGWPSVDPLQMQVGTTNPAVAALRKRLQIEGDLKGEPSGFSGPEYFDQEVSDALKRWQGRYGLGETGDLLDPDKLKNGTRTVIALNVTAEARLAQLKANLTRLQQKQIGKGRYVLVNIPGEQIEAIENNKVVLRLNGVVGRPERPSPLLVSNIADIKFNPIWNMPPTVLKEDLLPKAKALQAVAREPESRQRVLCRSRRSAAIFLAW